MIEIHELTKKYGSHTVVENISFNINEHEVLGFLGRNGAGKSTTMNMITGYITPTAGSIKVDGYDLSERGKDVRKRIGYLPEQPPVYPEMTVNEYLQFVCRLKGVASECVRSEAERLMEAVHIVEMKNRLIRNLSKGYRQRVGIAQAMAASPPYIILDEPSVGLDPVQIAEIRQLIIEIGKEHTVLLSSHILPEIEETCQRVVILHQGRIRADINMKELYSGNSHIILQLLRPREDTEQKLMEIEGVRAVEKLLLKEKDGFEFKVSVERSGDIRERLASMAVMLDWGLLELSRTDIDLERYFMDVINGGVTEE